MATQKCTYCKRRKPLTIKYFSFRTDSKSFRKKCKVCKNKEVVNNRLKIKNENPILYEKIKQKLKLLNSKWVKNNPKKAKLRNVRYARSKQGKKARAKYYKDNIDNIKRKNKKHRKDNIIFYRERGRAYYKKNAKKIRRRKYIQRKNRMKYDHKFRLRISIGSMISVALSRNGGSKKGESSMKYMPFTIPELCVHIESLFEPWMHWGNRGLYIPSTWDDNDWSTWKWQLDHIIPQSKLPFSSMNDANFKKCWSLKNLRPYSAKQNIKDGCNR